MENLPTTFDYESTETIASWAVQHESIVLRFESLSAAASYVTGFQSAAPAGKDIDFARRVITLCPRAMTNET